MKLSENPYIPKMLGSVSLIILSNVSGLVTSPKISYDGHQAIVDAMAAGDAAWVVVTAYAQPDSTPPNSAAPNTISRSERKSSGPAESGYAMRRDRRKRLLRIPDRSIRNE